MDPERYRRLAEVFSAALDHPDAERGRFVELECAGDHELRGQVEALLGEALRSSTFLQSALRRELAAAPYAGSSALPERLGGYRILRLLGAGGMGEVYLAEQERPHRKVALKIMRPGLPSDEGLRRFQQEAELLGRVQHSGIAHIYEAGAFETPRGPCPFIAMQLIDGLSLARRGTPADAAEATPRTRAEVIAAVALAEKVARALHAAHEAGVVHRDVKPQNIMLAGGEPVLVDFGIARDLSGEAPGLTLTGEQVGTPAYMSPEQAAGKRPVIDRRTDVWSLGVVLFELLTGERPFERPNRLATLDAIARAPLPDPRRLNPMVPRDLAVVIATALERDLGRRYQTALAFAEDLARVRRQEPVAARPAGVALRLLRWTQRHPAVAASLAVTMLSMVAGLAVTFHLLVLEREARVLENQARTELQEQTDALLLADLLRRADDLWPLHPETVPAMDAWLQEAGALVARLGPRDASRGEAAERPPLRALREGAPHLAEATRAITTRRDEALRVGRASVDAAGASWRDAAALVRDSRRYGGLDLAPEVGLAPLGFDSGSGLLECFLVATGDRPDWTGSFASGTARVAPESAAILVLLPPADFRRGAQRSDPAGFRFDPAAEPQEGFVIDEVRKLAPFFIGKHEVTQAQWMRVMGTNDSYCRPGATHTLETFGLTHPAEQVSFDSALRFLRRLGLELPSEDEWEYAARGGTDTPFWTGSDLASLEGTDNIADLAWRQEFALRAVDRGVTWDDGHAYTSPVGSFRANPFGLFDVLGNVREWCADAYDPSNGSRVLRGGCWLTDQHSARVSWRFGEGPATAWGHYGLRALRRLRTSPATPR